MKQILGHQEPDWLRSFADRWSGRVKVAMRSEDLAALQSWNTTPGDLVQLRNILGKIFQNLNSVSEIYNYGSRNPDQNTAAAAQQALPDLQNLPALKTTLAQTSDILIKNNANAKELPFFNNLIHSIQQSNFSEPQIQALNSIANFQNQQQARQGFRDEANPAELRKFLKQSVYGKQNSYDVSLTVVREALQNACDAVVNRGNKLRDPNHIPTIEIKTHYFKDEAPLPDGTPQQQDFMDLMIIDNGIGMNWDVLSNKFFRYFESGKGDQGGVSAGGFGIAKALIQETPTHGWSIDTNGGADTAIHSSRFGRNMYLGTPVDAQYAPSQSGIRIESNGTTLTLYGIPNPAGVYSIRELCSNYAIGQVNILVDGTAVEPRFKLANLKKLGENLEGLTSAVSDNPTESEVAGQIAGEMLKNTQSWSGDMKFEPAEGKFVNIEFAVNKKQYGYGNAFYLLNGQFQFEAHEYMSKADIIVNLATNLTPKDEGYPVDPGRVNLTDPYKEETKKVIEFLKKVLEEIGSHQLFKDGIQVSMLNSNYQPMESDEGLEDPEKKKMMDDFSRVSASFSTDMFQQNEQVAPQEAADKIEEAARKMNLNVNQMGIVGAMAEALRTDPSRTVDYHKELEKVIEGLTTPASIIVQKNFVSLDSINQRPEVTRHLMLLWQRIIKLVAIQATKKMQHAKRKKKFVPGMVFSDECIALYQGANPRYNQAFDTISINPITIASLVDPELFDKLIGEEDKDYMPSTHGAAAEQNEDLTLLFRLTSFLMHAATHEVTHLLFPETYGNDNFHINISKVERACHFLEPEIRKEVRKHIRGLRSDMKKMLRMFAKDRKKQQKS